MDSEDSRITNPKSVWEGLTAEQALAVLQAAPPIAEAWGHSSGIYHRGYGICPASVNSRTTPIYDEDGNEYPTLEAALTAVDARLIEEGWLLIGGVPDWVREEDETSWSTEKTERRLYAIWSEGFAATGQSGTATLWGSRMAESFKEACDMLAKHNHEFRANYDPTKMTHWGCRLFESEREARRSFG